MTFCQLENEAAFTCSADRTIRKWDVRTGQCLQVFRGHTSIVNRSVWAGARGGHRRRPGGLAALEKRGISGDVHVWMQGGGGHQKHIARRRPRTEVPPGVTGAKGPGLQVGKGGSVRWLTGKQACPLLGTGEGRGGHNS